MGGLDGAMCIASLKRHYTGVRYGTDVVARRLRYWRCVKIEVDLMEMLTGVATGRSRSTSTCMLHKPSSVVPKRH